MATAQQPPPVGQAVRIGQYRMSKTLGIGSFGKVKRACCAMPLMSALY